MNACDVLKYGHQTVLRTIDGLPQADWETSGVCGYWSVKDLIAHLASFEHVLVDVLNGFLEGGPTPYLDKYTDRGYNFNDSEVALRHGKSADDVLSEYNATQAKTMTLVAQISEETIRQPGTLPWYGMEYALDDYIAYAYYGHKREHSAQIAVFRDQVKR